MIVYCRDGVDSEMSMYFSLVDGHYKDFEAGGTLPTNTPNMDPVELASLLYRNFPQEMVEAYVQRMTGKWMEGVLTTRLELLPRLQEEWRQDAITRLLPGFELRQRRFNASIMRRLYDS